MHLPRIIAASLLAIACNLQAQVPAAEKTVSLEFSLFAWRTDLPAMRYSPKDKVEPVESFMRSDAHSYTGPATLRLYPVGTKLPPADGTEAAPLASVNLPEGATRVTLITVARGGGQFRMLAVPEDGDSLPERSIRIHNFTDTPLAVGFDENSVVQIPAAGSSIIKPKGEATVIRVAREEDGRWRKLFNNVVELTADGRGNVVLAPDAGRPVVMFSLPPWPRKVETRTPSQAR